MNQREKKKTTLLNKRLMPDNLLFTKTLELDHTKHGNHNVEH